MFTTEATPTVAAISHRSASHRTLFLLLRVAIGIAILVYLAQSGQTNLSSLVRLSHAWPMTVAAVGFLLQDILVMSIGASLLFPTAWLSASMKCSCKLIGSVSVPTWGASKRLSL